jgi:membrane protein DedA with SNARE-associated domain
MCRFIPAGRTAVTLTCGITGYPRRRFRAATALAAGIWASYAFAIGRLGGKAFEQRPWAGLVLALAAALAVSGVVEAARRIAQRRAHTLSRSAAHPDGPGPQQTTFGPGCRADEVVC